MKKSEQVHHKQSPHGRWVRQPVMAGAYHPWLVDESSLTKRLQERYDDFSVLPLMVKRTKANFDECSILNISSYQEAFVREVYLIGGGLPVVFAHSVIPAKHLRGNWAGLTKLGQKPLGATLFSNPKIKRTPLRYKKLFAGNVLYEKAVNNMRERPAYLWARRSIFNLNALEIMVTEVFLPTLLNVQWNINER